MKCKNNIIIMTVLVICISIYFLGCSNPQKDTAEVIEHTIYDEEGLLNVFIEEVVGYNSDYLHFLPDDYDVDSKEFVQHI